MQSEKRGLHLMVFEGRFPTPLQHTVQFAVPPAFPGNVTRKSTPAAKPARLELPQLPGLIGLTLLDVFLYYPEERETREKDRKTRKHENRVAGLKLNLLLDSWSDSGYSLRFEGRYIRSFSDEKMEGNWEQTNVLALPADKGAALIIAATEISCMQEAVLGKLQRAGGNSGIQDPKIVKQTTPEYPPALSNSGVSGLVKLDVIITKEGRVDPEKLLLLYCRHALLAATSLQTILETWVFEPGLKEGVPVNVTAEVELHFKLLR